MASDEGFTGVFGVWTRILIIFLSFQVIDGGLWSYLRGQQRQLWGALCVEMTQNYNICFMA